MSSREYSPEKLKQVNSFRKIETLYKQRKYDEVRERLSEFLKDYPDDNFAWHYYAKLLMQEGSYEEALFVIETNRPEENFMMKIDLVKCFIELGRFEEVYQLSSVLYKEAKQEFTRLFLHKAIVYSLSKLNQQELIPFSDLTYPEEQMIKYDQEKALEYIKKTDSYNPIFRSDVDIELLIDEVEPLLPFIKPLPNTGVLSDTYLIEYPGIGVVDDVSFDILKVSTIHNTHDILTMYPVVEYKKYPKSAIYKQISGKQKQLKK